MRFLHSRTPLKAVFLSLLLLLFSIPAGAHFLLNLNVRIFHVEHQQDSMAVYLRTPMPYLVADKLGEAKGDALPDPAPFTRNALVDGQMVHFVDPSQIALDPLGLGRIAEDGLEIFQDGERLHGTVEAVTIHAIGQEPGFATLDEARAVFGRVMDVSALPPALYVGDSVVDIKVRFSTESAVAAYTFSSTLDPGLPDQDQTANLILDYGDGEPKVYRSRGLLTEPVVVTRSNLTAVVTFVWEGVRHILEGLDHVLFVICLVLGAITLRSLMWRVTGFTIGHSITLSFGFFGFVPSGAWFVPAVETGIALSIIYAAAISLRVQGDTAKSNLSMFVVTTLIGLLHGLGFSFVLQEILQVTSPNIWQSLLAFNVGVEVGQLLIVIPVWIALQILKRVAEASWRFARVSIAAVCILISVFWTIERTGQVIAGFNSDMAWNQREGILEGHQV